MGQPGRQSSLALTAVRWQAASTSVSPAAGEAGAARRALGPAYWVLLKPRIVAMLLVAGVAGLVAGEQGWPPVARLFWFLLAAGLAAGGSGALNQVLDRDIDGHMARTADRPLVTGQVGVRAATAYGLALVVSGVLLGAFTLGWTCALMLAAGVATYVGIYTLWLKRRSVWNVVIGGAAGSFMVLAGWYAARPEASGAGWWLALVLFWWSPSHFWPLAMAVKEEYRGVGVPMLPVQTSPRQAATAIFVNSLLLVGTSLWPALPLAGGAAGARAAWQALSSPLYLVPAALAGVWLLYLNVRLWLAAGGTQPGEWRPAAWRTFKLSGPYLGLVLLGVIVASVW